ncbi:hypothetical protein GCM10010468_35680 [Actinocorallia longicatena]|uniref:Uncharacterized protein n=1 Tax=Actinocorallia longicatena TaxID=111803 RepID=A0ABP6QAA3_9ACTN
MTPGCTWVSAAVCGSYKPRLTLDRQIPQYIAFQAIITSDTAPSVQLNPSANVHDCAPPCVGTARQFVRQPPA